VKRRNGYRRTEKCPRSAAAAGDNVTVTVGGADVVAVLASTDVPVVVAHGGIKPGIAARATTATAAVTAKSGA
jgi:hypothetical protein